jgi:hypothetical protein
LHLSHALLLCAHSLSLLPHLRPRRKIAELQRIFPVWLGDAKHTRSIKASVVERWLIISRYRLQAPFHSWYLFCQDVKFRERAQKSIVEVRPPHALRGVACCAHFLQG